MNRGSKTNFIVGLAFIMWAAATASGLAVLINYSATPGITQAAPALWPRHSTIIPAGHRPVLVLFLHPQCPCSRATVAELTEIMARVGEKIAVTVLVLRPETAADEWADTRLIRSVAAIPHVTVRADILGAEAARFHATTSGETYVYDPRGRLQFHGGITGARGHIGDNAGREAVQSLVLCGASAVVTTSAFGCPLHSTASFAPLLLSSP